MDNFDKAYISWERLGEVYYRKYILSRTKEINYKIDYSNCHIAVSRNGGLIAFVKKSKRFIMDVTNPIKDSIRVFYQDGTPVRPIKFGEKEKNIILFEFTDDENLICVMHDGKVFKFDIFISSFNFKLCGSAFSSDNIIDARLFEEGFVCLTQSGNFYIIDNFKEPNAVLFYSMKNISESYLPIDYVFISPAHSRTNKIELLVPHPKNGILNITENGDVKHCRHSSFINYLRSSSTASTNTSTSSDIPNSDDLGKVMNLNISPSGQYLSVFNDLGNLFVFPVHLDCEEQPRQLSMTKLSFKPGTYQIMWCSEDCVIIINNGTIFLVGPDNKLLKLDIIKNVASNTYQPNLYCIPEIDGVRIFTDESVQFLQKVSDDLYSSVFPLALDSSKKLVEAYKYAEEKRPNCDEEIRKIRQDLPDAVMKLLNAATTQWDISNQIYLVKAAQHGKTFLVKEEFNFNHFVEVCKDLRIMNNLRSFEPPRLITYEEYKKLESKQLINRLIKTQNFFLANEISIFQNLKIRKVYQKWAIAQIKNLPSGMIPAEEIGFYNEMQKKLSEVQGISYIKLAKKAFKFRKEDIGIKFLENEKSNLTKIPQYVELKKWDKALELAFETYDSNVIYTVIDKIMISESMETFKQIVSKYKKAEPVVIEYLKNNHSSLLKDFIEIKKNYESLFYFHVENFFQSSNIDLRRKNIKEAKNCIKIMETSKDKELNIDLKFYKNYIEDLEKSMMFKKELLFDNDSPVRQTDISSLDNSTFDIYKLLIKGEQYGKVEKKNKEYQFDVSPRKLSILRIRTYAENSLFDAVTLISVNLKSVYLLPIHLAELYIDYRQADKAVEYIKKITEEDYFDYKLAMLKFIDKYADALEVIISNKKCERKADYINDIINKAPEFKYKVDELCVKYKVQI